MSVSLSEILAVGGAGEAAVLDIYGDVKAGIDAGGGALAEAGAVVAKLVSDAKFLADLEAFVSAVKVL